MVAFEDDAVVCPQFIEHAVVVLQVLGNASLIVRSDALVEKLHFVVTCDLVSDHVNGDREWQRILDHSVDENIVTDFDAPIVDFSLREFGLWWMTGSVIARCLIAWFIRQTVLKCK